MPFRAGSNYTKLYQLQLHNFFISTTITVIIFQINYNYTVSISITLCGTKYIQLAFVNYVFLHVLLNLNILHTIDKQNITVMVVHFVEL